MIQYRITSIIPFLFAILTFVATASAQTNKGDRMARDIDAAKHVLSSLLDEDHTDNQMFHNIDHDDIEGRYIKDYGVKFTVKSNSRWGSFSVGNGNTWVNVQQIAKKAVKEAKEALENLSEDSDPEPEYEEDENENEDENEGEDEDENENFEGTMVVSATGDGEPMDEEVSQTIITFLGDYGTILSQLNEDEKIGVEFRNTHGSQYPYKGSDHSHNISENSMSFSVGYGDIKAYQAGRLDKEEFAEKVEISDRSVESEKVKDYELFSTIIDRLYSQEMTETFWVSSPPVYEIVADYGVIFHMKVYSSYAEGGRYRMPTVDKAKLTKEERDAQVTELYPKFVQNLKENMVEYGRLLNVLDQGKNLELKVDMTKCFICDLPETVSLVVSKDVLKDYERTSLSLQSAADKVMVKK